MQASPAGDTTTPLLLSPVAGEKNAQGTDVGAFQGEALINIISGTQLPQIGGWRE